MLNYTLIYNYVTVVVFNKQTMEGCCGWVDGLMDGWVDCWKDKDR